MSVLIDPRKVTDVLLADGWHSVQPRSFSVDDYAYGYYYQNGHETKYCSALKPGQDNAVASMGFSFIDSRATDGRYTSGPLTAILAVNHLPNDT